MRLVSAMNNIELFLIIKTLLLTFFSKNKHSQIIGFYPKMLGQCQAWWCTHVILAIQGLEVGELNLSKNKLKQKGVGVWLKQ
jgi:hypothetical protein